MRFRKTNRRPFRDARRHAAFALRPEQLEARQVLSGAPAAWEPALINWDGREILAIRDSYVVQMPQTNAATSKGLWDYTSITPSAEPGWSIHSLGMGYFSVDTPGASATDVQAWSLRVGASAISPNTVLEKQALPPKLPNDPRFVRGQQWGLNNIGQPVDSSNPSKVDADIDAPEAWVIDPINQNTGSRNIVVAIMDDGIDYTHPDLQANVWQRPANVPENDPKLGYVGRFGFDVANGDKDDPSKKYYCTMPGAPNDVHGTAVAGIIGAKGNNNIGLTGVNWDVGMLSANIFKDGGVYSSSADFLTAVNRIIGLKMDYGVNIAVVNASWMSVSFADSANLTNPMAKAVAALNQAGILFVTAAGNGYDAGDNFGDFVGDWNDGDLAHLCPQVWPGNYYAADPLTWGNVITVGASTPADTLARFSNFSTTNVHIAAPGVGIWTTVPLKTQIAGAGYPSHESIQSDPRLAFLQLDPWSQTPQGINGGYAQLSGTSMSAAYVSGVAALAAAEYMRWTGVLPAVSYLRRAVVDQADRVSTLTYTETTSLKPDILGRMTPDPMHHKTHSIEGDRRLNAYNTVKWVRENLPPKVTFANASVLEGDSGKTDVVIQAVLNRKADKDLTISYWTETYPNEAVGGVDFVPIPASAPLSFTIPAGQTSVPVTLPSLVFGDTSLEPNERFWLKFKMDPLAEAWLGSKSLAVTIVSDDSSPAFPAATLDPATKVVVEGDGGSASPTIVDVPVTLDFKPARTILVPYRITTVAEAGATLPSGSVSATPGVDFIAMSGTLTFSPGQDKATIRVRIVGDRVQDMDASKKPPEPPTPAPYESFAVQLLQPNPGVLKQGKSVKIITIEDDDAPSPPVPPPTAPVSIQQPTDVIVKKGLAAGLSVELNGGPVPSGYSVTIFYRTVTGGNSGGTAVAGADFQAVTMGKLVIPAGQLSGSISIQTFDNRLMMADRDFFVEISSAVYTKVGSTLPSDSIQMPVTGLKRSKVTIHA